MIKVFEGDELRVAIRGHRSDDFRGVPIEPDVAPVGADQLRTSHRRAADFEQRLAKAGAGLRFAAIAP